MKKLIITTILFVYAVAFADVLETRQMNKLKLKDQVSGNAITIEPPSLGSSYSTKAPATQGSANQVLKTDGSGNQSWTSTLLDMIFGNAFTTTQITKPASPSAGFNKVYTKADNKLYVLDSSGNEKSAGGLSAWAASTAYNTGDVVLYSGNSYIALSNHTSNSAMETDISGGKWQLVNTPVAAENILKLGSNWEDNTVAGWTAVGCATVTNNFLACNGSGGAVFSAANGGRAKNANTSNPAIGSTGPLNGTYSLNMATGGANAAGDMYISPKISIPLKYQAKTLNFKLDYKVKSGTIVEAGNLTNTLGLAIYDVTNNSWQQLAGTFSFSGAGIASGTWQVPANTTDVQLAIYYPNAAGGATSVYVDDIYFGPQSTNMGVPVTDWVSYTLIPQGTTTNPTVASNAVSNKAVWRRVGDSMEISYTYYHDIGNNTGVATGSGTYLFPLPSGYTIDSNKIYISIDPSAGGQAGNASGYSNTSTLSDRLEGHVYAYNSTRLAVSLGNASVNTRLLTSSDFSWGNNTIVVNFLAKVPISGWSSNTVMSSDLVYSDDVGSVHAFAAPSSSPPQGYLYADGSAISRVQYYDLFNKIGTTFGSGDGSTTFNLPDLRGVFVRGAGSQTISGNTYSGTLGTKQTDQMQGHKHTDSGHSHTFNVWDGGSNGTVPYAATAGTVKATITTSSSSANLGDPTATTYGTPRIGTQTHPANISLTYFIKYVKGSVANIAYEAKAPTIQSFLSGSGTYTRPSGVKFIRVKMVGGGGGGSGSATIAANNGGQGGAGSSSTFGSSLLTAGGGAGAVKYSGTGAGGDATINSPAISIFKIKGAQARPGHYIAVNAIPSGGNGADSFLGGSGAGGEPADIGQQAATNTGSGGGGAGGISGGSGVTGAGGAAGAYIEAQINSPSATYSYTIGAGGNGGAAGTSGFAGGAGGSGIIIVEEYYN